MRLLLLFAVLNAAAWADTNLRIFYTSNRQGEADPCGCQVNQIGGMDRFLNRLVDLRKTTTGDSILVNGSDTFFPANELNRFRKDQELAKATMIAKATKLLGVDVMAPGQRDFAGGLEKLKELAGLTGSKWVAGNLFDRSGNPIFEKYVLVEKGGAKIGVTSLLNPDDFHADKALNVKDPKESWKTIAKELKEKGAQYFIVLSNLGSDEDRKLNIEIGPTVIVGSRSLDTFLTPEAHHTNYLVQPMYQGQQLGVLDFKNADIVGHQLVDLDKKWATKNAITELIAKYKQDVRDLSFIDDKRPRVKEGKAYVAKPWECRECHRKQYDFWQTTNHASAYLVLYAKDQHFDPECIACHSLGYLEPGGFEKIAVPIVEKKKANGKTIFIETFMKKVFAEETAKKPLDSREEPDRYQKLKKKYHAELDSYVKKKAIVKSFISVQCEHCHGNRNGHPDPKVNFAQKIDEKTCTTCHKPPRDNHFVFAEKVKLVGCPLSSKP